MFGLSNLAVMLDCVFWLCFVLLGIWFYIKYSGEYKEIGEHIDGLADWLLRTVNTTRPQLALAIEK
jgi:hypothetical protein